MATLFDVGVSAINKHINNIYKEGELIREATVSKMEIVQSEGKREITRNVDFFNLDAIISVGYRVNSKKASEEYEKFKRVQKIVSDYDVDFGVLRG